MIKHLIISMRPKQWVKNLFVFSALLFVKGFYDFNNVLLTVAAFGLFCAASSAVYLLNDLVDLPKDREHPLKKTRPLAAGKISVGVVSFTFFLLSGAAIMGAFYIGTDLGLTVSAYILLNIVYSFALKRMVILDVMSIAFGFVLRVIAGAVAIQVPFSTWLLLCTFFLALFLALTKRKNEFLFKSGDGARSVLQDYSAGILEQMITITAAATIISYAFYTFSSEHSKLLMLTIPIVLYGLFYYLHALSRQTIGDNGPSDVFLRERPLQVAVLFWIFVVTVILIYGK